MEGMMAVTDKPNTSAKAVERLAAEVVSSLPDMDVAGARVDPLQAPAVIDAMVALDIAATLRTLLAERDAARAALLPFARIWRINATLNPDQARPLAQFIAGAWPVMADVKRASDECLPALRVANRDRR